MNPIINSITLDLTSSWAVFSIHFGLFPQAPLLTSSFFLYHSWAFLGYTMQHSGRLFTTWMISNLATSVFLHHLHPHPSPSSSRIFPGILVLWNSLISSPVRLIYIFGLLGWSGKSVCSPCPPLLPSHLYWPIPAAHSFIKCFPHLLWYPIPYYRCPRRSWKSA
jgi:hypothetical protein